MGCAAVVTVRHRRVPKRRRTAFRPGEWLRAMRPFLCRCGHARSHHASGRGRCARCVCDRPVRATGWSLLAIGYRIGFEAGRLFREHRPLVVADILADAPTVALEQQVPADLADELMDIERDRPSPVVRDWNPAPKVPDEEGQ